MERYHNTNGLVGIALKSATKKCKTQEDAIFEFFRNFPTRCFAPHEIHRMLRYPLKNPPLTSVRRAMSNLTRDGQLIKTRTRVDGPLGKPVYTWKLNEDRNPTQAELFQGGYYENRTQMRKLREKTG